MALNKLLTISNGNESQYHKIERIDAVGNGKLKIIMSHYKDQQYRILNAPSLWEDVIIYEWDDWKDQISNGWNGCYKLIKKLPDYIDSEDIIDMESISLNKTEISISIGSTIALVTTIYPENTTDKILKWTSSDETIASVESGVVTGIKSGTAIISVTNIYKNIKCECSVTIL